MLDFVVTFVAIIDSAGFGPFGIVRITPLSDSTKFAFRLGRGMRALRPLQVVRYFQGIRDILVSLAESMSTLASVIIFLR